jgi:hypothetical protein
MENKTAVQSILITLGCAFLLLGVVEWKNLADQFPPSDDGVTYDYSFDVGQIKGGINYPILVVSPAANYVPATTGTGAKQATGGQQKPLSAALASTPYKIPVPWGVGVKAFVYTWIGGGLLVTAFIKPKGVSGGYW